MRSPRAPNINAMLTKGSIDPKYINRAVHEEYDKLHYRKDSWNRKRAKEGKLPMSSMEVQNYDLRVYADKFISDAIKFIEDSWLIDVAISVPPEAIPNEILNLCQCEDIHNALKTDTKSYYNKASYCFHVVGQSNYIYLKSLYVVKNDNIFDFEGKSYHLDSYWKNRFSTDHQIISTRQCGSPRVDLESMADELLHVERRTRIYDRAREALKAKAITSIGGRPFRQTFPNAPAAKIEPSDSAYGDERDLLDVPF